MMKDKRTAAHQSGITSAVIAEALYFPAKLIMRDF